MNNHIPIWTFRGERQKVAKFYTISTSIRKQFENILKNECPNKLILEYGCGAGSYIKFSLDNNAKAVIGIDIDQKALLEAKSYLGNKEKCYLVLMDAENMAFKSQTFDVICGVGILHHISLNKVLPEISRVLNNDGLAIFMEPLGHIPILNLFRKLTPKLRDKKEHPLRKKDLDVIKNSLPMAEFQFFYLLSFLSFIFKKNLVLFLFSKNFFGKCDRLLFNIFPLMKYLAWQVLIIFKK